MESCFCHRLYRAKATVKREYVFCGSLCRIREFETLDGLRHCITIFSLSDYKQLHFPYDEYKIIISKLNALLSTEEKAIFNNANDSALSIRQQPFNGKFKIQFGVYTMTIGPVTAFGLLKTSPFINENVSVSANETQLTCNPMWDICACKSCPIFKRLVVFKKTALIRFLKRRM